MKCITCHKPIIDGEALYGARSDPANGEGQHYDCKFPNGYKDPMTEARAALKRLDEVEKELHELGKLVEDPVIDSTATTPTRRRRK